MYEKSILGITTALLLSCCMALAGERPEACAGEAARQFDFWPGEWRVESRYRTGPDQWLQTEGRWLAEQVVGGCVIIDFADGAFSGTPMEGMGTRYWDPRAQLWVITWISTAHPGKWQEWRGRFVDGVGNFYSASTDEVGEVYSRLQWSDIMGDSAAWNFAVTRDGGTTWETHWLMEFERTAG